VVPTPDAIGQAISHVVRRHDCGAVHPRSSFDAFRWMGTLPQLPWGGQPALVLAVLGSSCWEYCCLFGTENRGERAYFRSEFDFL
jgi:hypothetical protein